MTIKRSWIVVFATLVCLSFAWETGAGRPHPASAGGVIDPTCTSSSPCIEYDNNGTGPGIRGVSLSGNGSVGFTKVNAFSAANGRAGVFGNDLSTSGNFNSGVHGLSPHGTGVLGESTGGFGVSGSGSTGVVGNGQYGVSAVGSLVGVFGHGPVGVAGTNTSSARSDSVLAFGNGGRLFRGHNSHSVDVFTVDDGGNMNLTGGLSVGGHAGIDSSSDSHESLKIGFGNTSDYGIDSIGNSVGVIGSGPVVGVVGISTGMFPAIEAFGGGGPIYEGFGTSGQVFTVYDNGSVQISGHLFTSGSCSVGCAEHAATPGHRVISYAPSESLPTMEDTGEAQLVNGAAYVRIDSAFANVIDKTANYVVLITPEGDSRGLYITQKSATGFAVHENQGGRSTLAFGYRIVAKPYGSTAARLPMIYMPKTQPHRPSGLRPNQLHA